MTNRARDGLVFFMPHSASEMCIKKVQFDQYVGFEPNILMGILELSQSEEP
jgi:hypothetical protein